MLCDGVIVVVCSLLLWRLMQLRWWICNTGRWQVLLLRFLQAFCRPSFKDFCHQLHPLGWSACEVIFDGLVLESDEVVILVVRRDGDVLTLLSVL